MQLDYKTNTKTTMTDEEYRSLYKRGDVKELWYRQKGKLLNKTKSGKQSDYSFAVCNNTVLGYFHIDRKTKIVYHNEPLFQIYREIVNERLAAEKAKAN